MSDISHMRNAHTSKQGSQIAAPINRKARESTRKIIWYVEGIDQGISPHQNHNNEAPSQTPHKIRARHSKAKYLKALHKKHTNRYRHLIDALRLAKPCPAQHSCVQQSF